MNRTKKIALILIIPTVVFILSLYIVVYDMSEEASAEKCDFIAGLIDSERTNLDNGITDNWDEHNEMVNDWLIDCIDIPREELWRFEGAF